MLCALLLVLKKKKIIILLHNQGEMQQTQVKEKHSVHLVVAKAPKLYVVNKSVL